jgi:pyridoxine 5-phosphate synthase
MENNQKTALSVNINKFALVRNSRTGNNPDILQIAKIIEELGADGLTIHPRPDERHARYDDVFALKTALHKELNVEGNPKKGRFLEVCRLARPTQATLVPDADNVLTSSEGWDTIKNFDYLKDICQELSALNIRTSVFVEPDAKMIEAAAKAGIHRIELYTGHFAEMFPQNPAAAVAPYTAAANIANEIGIGINAGHDLSLKNLKFFKNNVPGLAEVSIGHALVCDTFFLGLEETVKRYLQELS